MKNYDLPSVRSHSLSHCRYAVTRTEMGYGQRPIKCWTALKWVAMKKKMEIPIETEKKERRFTFFLSRSLESAKLATKCTRKSYRTNKSGAFTWMLLKKNNEKTNKNEEIKWKRWETTYASLASSFSEKRQKQNAPDHWPDRDRNCASYSSVVLLAGVSWTLI